MMRKALSKIGINKPRETLDLLLHHKILGHPYYWTDFPPVIQIDISNYCGPKYCKVLCEYCFPQHQIAKGVEKYAEMPMEWIEWIFRNIAEYGRDMWFYTTFLNGDGLTDLRLPEILRMGKRYAPSLPSQTFTCGTVTENAWLLCDKNLDWVCFTLSAHNREVYKKVHRGDRFDNVIETMRYVDEHHHSNQQLEVHYVVTENNFPFMGDWLRMIETDFPDWEPVFSPLVESVDNVPSKKALGSLTLEQQENEILRVAGDKYKFWKHDTTALRQPCVLWNNCSIHVTGAILQCCNWADPLKWNYGFIQKYIEEGRTLRDYWLERLANKMRNPLCRSCNLRHPDFRKRLSRIKMKSSLEVKQ